MCRTPRLTGVGGFVAFQVDLNVMPGGTVVLPGEHWFFQMWFRDVGTSNTTDGTEVMFR